MIRIRASVQPNGCLQTLEATGHAAMAEGGFSPVCAGVTTLLRTGGELLEAEGSLPVRVFAPTEGTIRIWVGSVPDPMVTRIQGITDFLLFGLHRLSMDAPEEVCVIVNEHKGD